MLISDIASDVELKLLTLHQIVLRSSVNKHCLLMTPPYEVAEQKSAATLRFFNGNSSNKIF